MRLTNSADSLANVSTMFQFQGLPAMNKNYANLDNSADNNNNNSDANNAHDATRPPSPASTTTGATAASSNNSPKSSASTTPTPTATATRRDSETAQRLQDRKVCYIRGIMITTILTATAAVSTTMGSYVASDERSNFEIEYEDSVSKVAEAFQHRIDTKRDTAKTFSAMITSRYGNVAQAAMGKAPLWPNVTIPDFQEQTASSLTIADGRALSFNPIITQDVDRVQWEAHAAESAWILGDEGLITPETDTVWPDNRTVSFGIYSRDANRQVIYDPGYSSESKYQDVMVPVWQIAPIKTNEKAVMFNLHSESNRREALDHMMEHEVQALTAILQLVQDGTETRPSSILFDPVFDAFSPASSKHHHSEDDGEEEEEEGQERSVVGSISIVFSWDTLLDNILPDYIKGIVCVLRSSTGQVFSYGMSGHDVTLLDEGDVHDTKYDEYGRHVKANLNGERSENEKEDSHLDFITYDLYIYPSSEFEKQYVTHRASIYAGGVVLIFVFMAGLFMLYDYLVEHRQQNTARMAQRAGNIVDSMFPANFRERLYSSTHIDGSMRLRRSSIRSSSTRSLRGNVPSTVAGPGAGNGTPLRRTISTVSAGSNGNNSPRVSFNFPQQMNVGRNQIKKFIKTGGKRSSENGHSNGTNAAGDVMDDEPIADLFHDTSIMFSDIVGFTKWSSERSPNEVFRLLEQIFWEFDEIAARHNVFKLGTIGDCYIAVTGIPDPNDEHATVLTQFAFDARDKVHEVCAKLENEGLDTAKLDMRFGIHSGDTTAGILRGTKSRFELFGDTINTASRMESTGLGGKIHVSEETADLIRRSGKTRWLIKRDTMITAKGKGQLQTYWAEPHKGSSRVSFSEKFAKFFSDDSFRNSRASFAWSLASDVPEDGSDRNGSGRFNLLQWAEDEEDKIVEEDADIIGITAPAQVSAFSYNGTGVDSEDEMAGEHV